MSSPRSLSDAVLPPSLPLPRPLVLASVPTALAASAPESAILPVPTRPLLYPPAERTFLVEAPLPASLESESLGSCPSSATLWLCYLGHGAHPFCVCLFSSGRRG